VRTSNPTSLILLEKILKTDTLLPISILLLKFYVIDTYFSLAHNCPVLP
jgi:hypothetical protein